jgi:hypothetical protein
VPGKAVADPPTGIRHAVLLWGLARVNIPTGCFQVESYACARRRISWFLLFDFVLALCPGYGFKFPRRIRNQFTHTASSARSKA